MAILQDQTLEFCNLGRLDWDAAAREQERVAEALTRGECPATVLFVEHEPVYTYGLRFRRENFRLRFDPAQSSYCGVPVRRAFRGGELTHHGPGQLVVYPILRLARGGHTLRRLIELYQDIVIEVLRELRIAGFARPDAVGVWTERGKIASIGIGLRRGVTRNGFAINVSVDSKAFEPIVPCGRPEPIATINDFVAARQSAIQNPKSAIHNPKSAIKRISVDDVRALVEKHFIRLGTAFLPRREDILP
jgi:lipoyl(octanoyl) transferase